MAKNFGVENLRRNIREYGNMAIQRKIQQEDRKRDFADKIKSSLLTAAVSGKVRPKVGANFEGLGDLADNPDFGQVLGRVSELYEPMPAKVSVSRSTAQVPFSDLLTAHGILGASGESLYEKGLATEDPKNILEKVGGFFTGAKPTYTPTAQFDQMRQLAEGVLKNPTKTTTRVTSGQILGANESSEMPDASQYEEGTTAEDDAGNTWVVENGEWVQK